MIFFLNHSNIILTSSIRTIFPAGASITLLGSDYLCDVCAEPILQPATGEDGDVAAAAVAEDIVLGAAVEMQLRSAPSMASLCDILSVEDDADVGESSDTCNKDISIVEIASDDGGVYISFYTTILDVYRLIVQMFNSIFRGIF